MCYMGDRVFYPVTRPSPILKPVQKGQKKASTRPKRPVGLYVEQVGWSLVFPCPLTDRLSFD